MSSSSRGASCHWLQQYRFAAILLVILPPVAASSCAEKPLGEFTADDCDDPDCWVFCPFRGTYEIGDASSSIGPDASDAMSQPAADSGKPRPLPDDDAGAPIDASTDDDAGSTPGVCDCAPDEACVAGQCKPTASTSIEGTYTLRVKSALVPNGPSADRCFDYPSAACLARILPLCDCERPDPYVVITLNGTVLMKATTTPVRDTTNPLWTDSPSVTVDLKATDKLTFLAFDSDGIGSDPQIFSCLPALSALESGTDTLSCNPRAGTTVTPPAGSTFIITVGVKKIVPDASMP
jgi:C2 domain